MKTDIRFGQPSMKQLLQIMRRASKKKNGHAVVDGLRRSNMKSRLDALRRPDGKMVRELSVAAGDWFDELPVQLGIPRKLLFGSQEIDS